MERYLFSLLILFTACERETAAWDTVEVSCIDHSASASLEPPLLAERAIELIWREVYSMDVPAPTLTWVSGPFFTWVGSSGRNDGVNGVTCSSAHRVTVWVAYSVQQRISSTSLAHELTHASFLLSGRDGDRAHASPEWSELDSVRALLESEGM
jgi:hypothetical protein